MCVLGEPNSVAFLSGRQSHLLLSFRFGIACESQEKPGMGSDILSIMCTPEIGAEIKSAPFSLFFLFLLL